MRRILVLGVAAAWWCFAAGGAGRAAEDQPVLGDALRSVFNPRTAPAQKTMGLLQRSFLDLVEESRSNLEVALVVDGTESMGDQLQSVRDSIESMMRDLELYKSSNISYQIVVYRDAGSPSGEVELPLQTAGNRFVADRDAVVEAFNKIQVETGAPYFPELADKGVHTALTELSWSTGDDTSRWIFLFGDAPPYDASFDEPENKASRRVATASLASLASEKGVRINCILCTSREEDQDAYQKVLDQTRQFMNDLSSSTGGLMLDLSYDDIRSALSEAAPKQDVEFREIGYIKQQDVEEVRRQASAAGSIFSEGKRIRVALLPHLPLDEMSFDPDQKAVQLATELRQRLRVLPGVEFKDSATVADRFKLLTRQGFQGESLLQMLARALGVDYVVWGKLEDRSGVLVATSAIYNQTEGRQIVQVQAATNPTTGPEQLGGMMADKFVSSSIPAAEDNRLRAVFASVQQDADQRSRLIVPVASGGAQSALLEGMEALEQALAYPTSAAEGDELLSIAHASLERAVENDDDNPLAQFLLSSCLFNQTRAKLQAGDRDAARELMRQFSTQLREAFNNRSQVRGNPALRTEIEGDYALLVRGNTPEAIRLYRQLLDENSGIDMQAARRAYWMLAGIYAGDWGVDEEHVDPNEAKQCLTQILALWPDSSEAALIKRVLRWDDVQEQTRFPHYPQENDGVAEMVDKSA